MEEGKFGVAESSGRVCALVQFAVECIHQLRRGGVADLPKRANDVVRASSQKSPREADQAFAGIGSCAGTVAGRDGHEISIQAMLDYLSRIELVSVASGFLAEDDRGFQRSRAAGRSVGYEMEVGEAARLAAEIGARCSLRTLQNRTAGVPKILLNLLHFTRGLGPRAAFWHMHL